MKGRQRMKLTTTRIIDILLIAICTAALIYFHLAKADRGQKQLSLSLAASTHR